MYKVIYSFTDLQDSNRVYSVGDTYPAKDAESPGKSRIVSLLNGNNKIGKPLIEAVQDKSDEEIDIEDMTVAQLQDFAIANEIDLDGATKKGDILTAILKFQDN